MSQADLFVLLPELVLAGFALVLLVLGVSMKGEPLQLISWGAVIGMAAALVTTLAMTPEQSVGFNGAFAADAFARTGRLFIYSGGILSLLLATRYLEREKLARFEYPILILLATIGMGLMVAAQDLIAVYMGIELQSLALYVMAAFNRDSRRSTEAGLKYFVLGALSSGFLLYGASLIYGFTGAINFDIIAVVSAEAENSIGLVFGLVFLMAGLAFKVSGAPFHMWTPDVYEGAPTPVTAFFAAAPKVAGMFLFVRVLMEAFPSIIDQWQPIVWFVAAASMIVGAFSAIVQTNIKRLLAYSSIGHVGYALIGLAAGTGAGAEGVVAYLGIYMITTLAVFACVLSMRRSEGMSENISDLSGLAQTRPGLALAFTALFFSLAGIPPFFGFFAKFAVFAAGVQAGLYILVVIGVVTSVVSTFYYLSILAKIWFGEPSTTLVKANGVTVSLTSSLGALVITVGAILLLQPLFELAGRAAASLY